VSSCLAVTVGFTYPFIASVVAIDANDQATSRKWLSYWVVFTAVIALDPVLKLLLFFLPLYNMAKVYFVSL
jgi:hypothetical protein